jgi:hypothetical protein
MNINLHTQRRRDAEENILFVNCVSPSYSFFGFYQIENVGDAAFTDYFNISASLRLCVSFFGNEVIKVAHEN